MVRLFAGLLSASVLTLALSSCTAVSDDVERVLLPDPETVTVAREDVVGIAEKLSCTKVLELADDVYHFDHMTGANCIGTDGGLMLRAYDLPDSVGQVLEGWEGAFDESREVMIGHNWFAVASSDQLDALAEILEVSPKYGVDVPPATPLTYDQGRLRACAVGVVTMVRNEVMNEVDQGVSSSYEEMFPGVGALSGHLAEELRGAGATAMDTFEYAIAEKGPEIKSACEAIPFS